MKGKKAVRILCVLAFFIVLMKGACGNAFHSMGFKEELSFREVFGERGKEKTDRRWKPEGLKVELLEVPLGINTHNPAFSWYVNGNKNGVYQKKYRIVLAESMSLLKGKAYLYDSGWCESKENTYVKLKGLEEFLEDNSVYYWKVRLEDMDGNRSDFSDARMFSTAVGTQWESLEGIWTGNGSSYMFLRKEFVFPEEYFTPTDGGRKLEKALLSITGLSPEQTRQYVYQAYINGACVGLGPSRMKGDHINYNTYDVTDFLGKENVLGIIGYSNTDQAVLCQICAYYSDGSKEVIFNSGQGRDSFRILDGDMAYGKNDAMISTPYYVANAENIDGTKYPYGWLSYGYDDSTWTCPKTTRVFDEKKLYGFESENMTRFEKKPEVVERRKGHYFIDLGKEIVGGIRIKIKNRSKEPLKLILRFGEELDEKGNVKYQMITGNVYEEKWTAKPGESVMENMGMKTFRYVDIYGTNICGEDICEDDVKEAELHLGKNSVSGLEIRQEFHEEESDFWCTSALLNEIYEMTKYTIKETNQNLYVDSQSRERGPYEGDVWINMLSSYSFTDDYTLARLSNEYLLENRTWPAEYPLYAIFCSYRDYMQTGNKDSLLENYPYLKRNIESAPVDSKWGLVKNNYGEDGFHSPLVDWPETERDGFFYEEAEFNTVVNAVACRAYESMSSIADALGQEKDASVYGASAVKIRKSLIKYLYDPREGSFSDGLDGDGKKVKHDSQHATAYALYADIYSGEEMRHSMQKRLERDGKIKMSVFGSYFLLQGLYETGDGGYANQLLLRDEKEDTHTWAHMLKNNNATITTEAWDTKTEDNMTYSHPWGAAPAALIREGLFGIKALEPGFKKFQIKLQPCVGVRNSLIITRGGYIESAYIKIPTIKGEIWAAYRLDRKFKLKELQVYIPSNTDGVLFIPKEIFPACLVCGDGCGIHFEPEGEFYKAQIKAGGHAFYLECVKGETE